MPFSLVGIIDVLLIYAIARRLFEREWVAVTGAPCCWRCRPDLVSRANADPMVTPEDVDTLPPASLAIVARSDAIDTAVDRLAAEGRMQADTLAAPDGTPLLWLLERQAR